MEQKPKDKDHFKRFGMEDMRWSLMRMVFALRNSFHLSESWCHSESVPDFRTGS